MPTLRAIVRVAVLAGCFAPCLGAQTSIKAPVATCQNHIVILYDFSGSVLNQGGRVTRVNGYIDRLLFEDARLQDVAPPDYVQANTLAENGFGSSLFQPGDCLSFYRFGMDRAVLEADLRRSGSSAEFWSQFRAGLIHGTADSQAPLFSKQKARQLLADRLPTGPAAHYYYTLSHYAIAALIASLPPDRFAARTAIVFVSDLFSGQNAMGTMDHALVTQRVPQFIQVLDGAHQFLYQHFSLQLTLLQLSVGGYEGIKIQVLEVKPVVAPQLSFGAGQALLQEGAEWQLTVPPLVLSAVPPGNRASFRPRQPVLVLQGVERDLDSFNELPFGATRSVDTTSWASTAIAAERTPAARVRWPVLYQPPGLYEMRLPLVLETPEAVCAVVRLPAGTPFWIYVAMGAVPLLAAGVIYVLWFRRLTVDLQFRPAWLLPDGRMEPDIQGLTDAQVPLGERTYWRLISAAGKQLQATVTIRNASSRLHLNRLRLRVKLADAKRPAALDAVRVRVLAGGRRYAPGEPFPIGPLRAGQAQNVSLQIDLGSAPEPTEDRRLPIDLSFVDEHGAVLRETGVAVEAPVGPLWLGIDPGTSGSCIAAGESPEDLALLPVGGVEDPRILRSFVYVCKTPNEEPNEALTYERDGQKLAFVCGESARRFEEIATDRCFYSPKRLIGYDEGRSLVYDGRAVSVRGRDAVSMLAQYLLQRAGQDLKERAAELGRPFKPPNKLAVAVPNMFTPAKIREMEDCCRIGGIRRVRAIYEAEAALMYYLWKSKELSGERYSHIRSLRASTAGEYVLIFDSGGASINLTYARVREVQRDGRTRSHIDIIQRVGYAVGGNRIDWEIGKIFWRGPSGQSGGKKTVGQSDAWMELARKAPGELPGLMSHPKSLNAGGDIREKWIALRKSYWERCEAIKKDYSAYWADERRRATPRNLFGPYAPWKDVALSLTAQGLVESAEIESIYKMLAEAFRELYRFAQNQWAGVDTLLCSGRSIQFPLVLELAKKTLVGGGVAPVGNMDPLPACDEQRLNMIDLKDAAKTCVALGAAYWAIQQANIELVRKGTFAHYGVMRQAGIDQSSREFITLIPAGATFQRDGWCNGAPRELDFTYAGGAIKFFQVMSSEPERALFDPDQRYKIGLLCCIRDERTKTDPRTIVGMKVSERDFFEAWVECAGTKTLNKDRFTIHDVMEDQDESAYWLMFPPVCVGVPAGR